MKILSSFIALLVTATSFGQIDNYSCDKSKLINGSGIAPFHTPTGSFRGFATFKENHLDGQYYWIDTSETYALIGEFKYRPSCMNYYNGIGVTFLSEKGDTIHLGIDSSLYNQAFKDLSTRIIEVKPEKVFPDVAGIHPDLNMGFGDPAVVPIGRWKKLNFKENYILEQYEFDECGNTLLRKYFKSNGSVINQFKYKPKNKKKIHWY